MKILENPSIGELLSYVSGCHKLSLELTSEGFVNIYYVLNKASSGVKLETHFRLEDLDALEPIFDCIYMQLKGVPDPVINWPADVAVKKGIQFFLEQDKI